MEHKRIRRTARTVLVMLLLFCVFTNALAATVTTESVTVETTAGGYENIIVTVTTEETDNGNGTHTTQVTAEANDQISPTGMTVSYDSYSNLTADSEGILFGTAESEYSSDNSTTGYSAIGGSKAKFGLKVPLLSADIPAASDTPPTNTSVSAPAGTSETNGDIKTAPDDGEYDYSMNTVIRQGKLTVTTVEDTRIDNVSKDVYDRDYLYTDAVPTADNDLFYDTTGYVEIPTDKADYPTPTDGYKYVYLGLGNASQYWAAYWYSSLNPDYPDETPLYTDKNNQPYYLRRGHKIGARYNIEGVYLHGKLEIPVTVANPAIYSSIFHFNMFDPATGKAISTYCADLATNALDGYCYNIVNLEDTNHYNDYQASMIRSIAMNGYWGIADDPATPEAEFGSLNAMREMMRKATDDKGNKVFTDSEIALLNDGIAMTATQYAIWTFSNAMSDVVFVNTHYIEKDANCENGKTLKTLGNVPDTHRGRVDLIFKLFDYLIHLEPTAYTEPTPSNTIINADNFTKDLRVTITGKPENDPKNLDALLDNDVYTADLSFALPFKPLGGEQDSLVVKILDENDQVLASGRISGDDETGDAYMQKDSEGRYTFRNIPLSEGGWNIKVAMEGWQQLNRGVCLFTSEIKDGESSQIMVGISEGRRAVDVQMDLTLETEIEEEVTSRQDVWRLELPYSEHPETGDSILLPIVLSLAAASVAVALFVILRRRHA